MNSFYDYIPTIKVSPRDARRLFKYFCKLANKAKPADKMESTCFKNSNKDFIFSEIVDLKLATLQKCPIFR